MGKQTYEKANEELQEILADIQSGKIGIDQLKAQTTRAATLIAFCQKKLRETEEQLDNLFPE